LGQDGPSGTGLISRQQESRPLLTLSSREPERVQARSLVLLPSLVPTCSGLGGITLGVLLTVSFYLRQWPVQPYLSCQEWEDMLAPLRTNPCSPPLDVPNASLHCAVINTLLGPQTASAHSRCPINAGWRMGRAKESWEGQSCSLGPPELTSLLCSAPAAQEDSCCPQLARERQSELDSALLA
jgi:hypothetical protein